MIKIWPHDPGVTHDWVVEIDFTKNGLPLQYEILPSAEAAIEFIKNWMSEEVVI